MEKTRIEEKLNEHDKEIGELKEKYYELSSDISSIKDHMKKVDDIFDKQVDLKSGLLRLEELFATMHKVIFQYNRTVDSLEYSIVRFNERLAMIKYIPLMILLCFFLALMFDGSTLENLVHNML